MWSILNGTFVNVITVVLGSLLGLSLSTNIPERYRKIILNSLGLLTIAIGIDAIVGFKDVIEQYKPLVENSHTYGARTMMVVIFSLLVGAIMGTYWRIHERIEAVGSWIHERFSGQNGHTFAEGFLTASVIFCIGPLTLLGCLENGAYQNPSYLYIKSLLDGFCSIALAASLGWGVLGSAFIVLGFQGGLSLLAFWIAEPLNELSIGLMTFVGGIIILATSLMILEIKKIPVANLLPGMFLPPLVVWLVELISPGLLLPIAG